MATRRNRIKGIANIPQRRKVEDKVKEVDTENKECLPDTESGTKGNAKVASLNVEHKDTPTSTVQETDNVADLSNNKNECTESAADPIVPKEGSVTSDAVASSGRDEVDVQNLPSTTNSSISQRRTFIKPKINLKSLSQKLKPKVTKIDLVPNECPVNAGNDCEIVSNPQSEIHIPPSTSNPISDSENIPEPQSPTKILNRSRIKAVPRLNQRRISTTIHGSASESEDDTRKTYKRVKTDSICSTASGTCEPAAKNAPDAGQQKESSSSVQKKGKRSEQSSKMAEAKRNFQTKFRNQAPEKQKLTMYDLIFYNPATKPMTKNSEQSDRREEERVDSPTNCDSPNKNVESDDDNNSVPVPQIKIGKNGEIIIDEKSLIVENKQTKKDRENLKNSELVNGDFDTGYGVYKKVRRSKDWSNEETLFFYKALHTLGTDFSLMLQLFPGRTRRELKMKFKKEDRINHTLIDKALSQPLRFNIKELKEEALLKQKIREVEEDQKQKRVKQLQQENKNNVLSYSRARPKRKEQPGRKRKVEKPKGDIYSKLEKGIASVWNNSNSDDENGSSDSSCEVTVSNILKQTRYGRIPNKKRSVPQKSVEAPAKRVTEQSKDLEPGAVMITCTPTPRGETTFKVFMVTPEHTQVPIDFPSDVINTFARNFTSKKNEGSCEQILEHNYTICHDDVANVTTNEEQEKPTE
ncbi:hypothetical protein PPYR_00455 [Photinus pyralis]|uniref:Myb-like domain-containing protein n=1 Tax=Photinus pyralis TaxID=7054 RepID=A0A1Y1JQS5_PHOPY|nr:transcription factor TFIIIB component B'' homolog [Photinus pyralis]KAB0803485.1 hypothetical protein PPYR_00455 [Photinus pyralis]